MLFHLFILFSLIYSTSCYVSCYDCSSVPSAYNYIITADRIPSEIENCSVVVNRTRCYIDIKLYLTTNTSKINVLPDDSESSLSEHTLRAKALMSGFGVIQQIQHSLYYFCSTDRCNNANTVKRILESLTLSNEFVDIENLLKPDVPFDGHGCLLYANQTDESCPSPSTIDPNTCKQCLTNFTTELKTDIICATCFDDDAHEDALGSEVFFNMTDRTDITNWFIYCQSKDCNDIETGHQIRNKSDISFDFSKFLDSNTGSKLAMSSSLITITLIIMGFIIKASY